MKGSLLVAAWAVSLASPRAARLDGCCTAVQRCCRLCGRIGNLGGSKVAVRAASKAVLSAASDCSTVGL